MTPKYEVSIDGKIIDFGNRLISLQISQDRERFDPIGSDSVEIVLEDTTEPRLAIPPRGRALRVKLGYEGQPLIDQGIYIVDETEVEGPPNRLVIRAQNNPKTPHSDSHESMATCKTRSWQSWKDIPLTVQDLVARLAVEYNLQHRISPSLASIALPHIDQTGMSDAELLKYVGRWFDVFMVVRGGSIIAVKNGEGQTASDKDIPYVFVHVAKTGETPDPAKTYLKRWRARFTDFQRYNTVNAGWHDFDGAKDVFEQAGTGGTPILVLPFTYPNQATAKAAAQTAYNRTNCAAGEFSCEFAGTPQLYSGGLLHVNGAHPDLESSSWYCRKVVHSFGPDGFCTEMTGERTVADMTAEQAQNAFK